MPSSLTFTDRDAARLISGPPRIAPLLLDLNVESGGTISASSRLDSMVVTWTNVPEFGLTGSNTFQVKLHTSGLIEFVYGNLSSTTPELNALVGVAKGNLHGPFNEIDIPADLPGTFAAGAIFEMQWLSKPWLSKPFDMSAVYRGISTAEPL